MSGKEIMETGSGISRRGIYVTLTVVAALIAVFGYLSFEWLFCPFLRSARLYGGGHRQIGAGTPGSVRFWSKRAKRGSRRKVLAEGRHFLNPIQYDVEIVPAVSIPLGKVGIVTAKVGRELPPGEIIAPDRESKGVWRDVLGPGLYRLNPEGYQIEIADAVNIPVGYVGVVTSQTGREPAPGNFAGPGEKGVLKDILQPGLYYLNRYAYQVNVIEIGMNQVTMSAGSNESVVAARTRLNSATTHSAHWKPRR